MTRRGAGAQLLLLVASLCWTGAGAQIHRKRVDESKKLTYIFLAAVLAALFFCLLYCLKKICPRIDMYTPLELDEIRLERAQDREGLLANKIDKMKSKLSNLRKSRTEVQTRRDIAASIEDRVGKFNAKGRQVYGEAWEGSNGAVPIRELVKIPDSDVRAMQMEAQAIVTARKEEEKQDLWDLWNKDDIELGNQNMQKADGGNFESSQSVSSRQSAKNIIASKTPDSARSVKETTLGVAPPTSASHVRVNRVPPPGVKPPTSKPPPPATYPLSTVPGSAGEPKRFGSKKVNKPAGGDGGASVVMDRNKTKVKIPSHLMKKYPPVTNIGTSNPQNQRPGINNRKPPPPIAPPRGPPPSHSMKFTATHPSTDRKFK